MLSATPEQFDLVAVEVVALLLEKGLLTREKAAHAQAAVREVLAREKEAEDELDREARALLQKYAPQAGSASLDTQAVLAKIKRKLAEEKGIVL